MVPAFRRNIRPLSSDALIAIQETLLSLVRRLFGSNVIYFIVENNNSQEYVDTAVNSKFAVVRKTISLLLLRI